MPAQPTPKPGDLIHLYDVEKTGPACGRGVGWVEDTIFEVTCEKCLTMYINLQNA